MTVIKAWNSGTSTWEVIAAGPQGPQGPPGSIGTALLDDLSDVTITSALPFQSINYDGTVWANDYAPLVSNVRNTDTVTLPVGTVVYLDGATGDRANVKRADYSSDATSSRTVGVVAQSIAVNATGPVVTRGYVTGVNLSAYTPGQILYLNTAGSFTSTKPSAPNHLVFVGVAVRCNSNGIMYVATQNGYELDELHNVQASSPSSGDFLKYNGTLWVSESIDLGTDTNGNYVAGVTAGTGVTVTGSGSEGATPTVAIGQDVGTTSSPSFNRVSSTVATGTSPLTVASTTVVTNLNADLLDGLHGATYANQFTYCTFSTRPSSPVVGQSIYETDTGRHLVYYGATTGWKPPWNIPWGVIDYKTDSTVRSTTSTTSSEITSLFRSNGSYIANRYLKVTVQMTMAHASSGGFTMGIVRSPASSPINEARVGQQSYNGYSQVSSSVVIPSTATAVYGVYWASSTAGQTVTNYNSTSGLGARFIIEDIGPLTNNPPAS